MVYIGSKLAAAAVALFLTWLIKRAWDVSWTQAAIVYLLTWAVLYDGRILQAAYEAHASKDTAQ
jgi:hypothetical protein